MPYTSKAQAAFFHMGDTPEGRAKLRAEGKKPVPKGAVKEFDASSRGKMKSLPRHVKAKK